MGKKLGLAGWSIVIIASFEKVVKRKMIGLSLCCEVTSGAANQNSQSDCACIEVNRTMPINASINRFNNGTNNRENGICKFTELKLAVTHYYFYF